MKGLGHRWDESWQFRNVLQRSDGVAWVSVLQGLPNVACGCWPEESARQSRDEVGEGHDLCAYYAL